MSVLAAEGKQKQHCKIQTDLMYAIQNPSLCIMYAMIRTTSFISGFASWDVEFVEVLKYSQIFHSELIALGDSTASVTEKFVSL